MQRILLVLIGFMPFLTANAQQVTNIQVNQVGDNVVISYDISSYNAGQTFDIKMECSGDGGKTFSTYTEYLTGDLKGITGGIGKKIVWDVLGEMDVLSGNQFVFQLVATVKNSYSEQRRVGDGGRIESPVTSDNIKENTNSTNYSGAVNSNTKNNQTASQNDCEQKEIGDFCFTNNKNFLINIYYGRGVVSRYVYRGIITLQPGQTSCIYELQSGAWEFFYRDQSIQVNSGYRTSTIGGGNVTAPTIISGQFSVEKCKSKTLIIQ